MKVDISIVIPIYKGSQYIPYWLDKVRKNAIYLSALHLECELILVNDFPEEPFSAKDFTAVGFHLEVLNSGKNQGIHGARVYGFEHAQGEWIVFLDQDDWITDDYLLKQKLSIDDADGVVCNGFSKPFCKSIGNYIYADNDEQKCVIDLSYYISTGNPIYSPGQVMLKKNAIPYLWHQNRLKENGADDYLLWMLMLREGKKFVLNEEKLYTHIDHGSNASNDMLSMVSSIHEVEELLAKNNLLSHAEKEMIENREAACVYSFRYTDIITTYDYWLYLESRNYKIADFLRERGYFKIGIYGIGAVGSRLYEVLADSDVEIMFAMDRRAKKFVCSIPVLRLEDVKAEDYMKQVNAIIVTAQSAFESIKKKIEERNHEVLVLSFKSILLEMIESIK